MFQIREIQPNYDLDGLRQCVIELQEFEKKLIPGMPSGEEIQEHYISNLFQRCEMYAGRIIVGIAEDCMAGFISVCAQMRSGDIDDGDSEFASIGDLIVLPQYRRKGLSRLLMSSAEAYARDRGAKKIRIAVLSSNTLAAQLYRSTGYESLSEQMEKTL